MWCLATLTTNPSITCILVLNAFFAYQHFWVIFYPSVSLLMVRLYCKCQSLPLGTKSQILINLPSSYTMKVKFLSLWYNLFFIYRIQLQRMDSVRQTLESVGTHVRSVQMRYEASANDGGKPVPLSNYLDVSRNSTRFLKLQRPILVCLDCR